MKPDVNITSDKTSDWISDFASARQHPPRLSFDADLESISRRHQSPVTPAIGTLPSVLNIMDLLSDQVESVLYIAREVLGK